MKKQTKTVLIIAIILVLAVIFIYPRWDQIMGNTKEVASSSQPGGPQGSGQPIPVNVVEIRPERLENNLSVTGTIIPNESVNLRAEISGLVKKISFNEGQFVKKGTPLIYLNDDELNAQYQRLDFTRKLFQSQENRQKQLLAKEAISQEEYDIVLNQFNTNLSDIKLVEAQLTKTVIRAPFDGVLGLRMISEGSVIGPSDVIANIVNIDPIKIEFSIPERYANQVSVGSKIIFSNESEGKDVEGTVFAFEPTIDTGTRTLKIRAQSPNRERKFLPGMFVRIKYILGVEENALMVPAESVIPELAGYKVFIVNQESKIEERKVSIGTRTESFVQIVDGLKEGDLVLSTGVLQVRTGMPVTYTKIN
ncbi:efflux RND transporter periplasmic adaptor subunit [Aquiflexum gelatinilyticum]|jgi:membrane fusion protein (multidrug efflux system)|uniref:Efflux RND transporter periplasmic adaptor subunit n=1 Tax=Aquiflexum gelatinilyticum TaxID=2961943 RepID=A0A9X2SZS0_9BACT|nr:efflux RND transporter periplasmic adaptor subunit [Aquiflexum gelatinilyticum]MCR9014166.1 efflux RND transporter periplasmic adaptor subunit [Aquiflexum gelatinilyticum]